MNVSVSFQTSAAYVNGDGAPSVSERELEVRWQTKMCDFFFLI